MYMHVRCHETADLSWFSRLPPPPRSTLFPYTTLFRSVSKAATERIKERAMNTKDYTTTFSVDQSDRKSTRLNSSHTVISYAVFCLKKKIDVHKSLQVECYQYTERVGLEQDGTTSQCRQ